LKKLFLIVLALTAVLVFAQDGRVKYSPAKPTLKDVISITYSPKNDASTIKNPAEMVVDIVFWKAVENYIYKQIPMVKDGDNFTANISIPNDSIVYVTFKFRSDKSLDDNNSLWWETYIYNDTGIELQGGHFQKALSSLLSFDLTRKLPTDDAIKELEREIELYPDNIYAKQTKWLNDIKQSDGNKEVIKDVQKKLQDAFEQLKNDETASYYIAFAADYANMSDLSNTIMKYYLTKDPKGKVVRLIRYDEIIKEKNLDMKYELLKSFFKDFKNADTPVKDILNSFVYNFYLKKKNEDAIKEFLVNCRFSEIYYYVNIGEIELSKDKNLKELSNFLDPALDLLKTADPDLKPAYMSPLTYKLDSEYKLGILSAMKGRILFELQDTLQAVSYLDVYYKYVLGDRSDYNALYVECLTKAGRYEDALRISSDIIRADKFIPGVEKYYEIAYEKVKGDKKGFDEKLKEDMAQRKRTQKSNLLRNRIDKLLPDFTLKNLNGKTVSFTDLKGKIIILDFWSMSNATCRTSLPSFQQAYEKYKNNENIKFFAINTREKTKGNEKEKSLKSFLNSNNYSFPVLLDDSTSKFVEKLGVENLPTCFGIDRDGNVQFARVGFGNSDDMIKEIDLWIELLLEKK
jgi:peroxiredoxin